jgi:hypothetical protein
MIRCRHILLALVTSTFLRAAEGPQEEFTLLQLDKQPTEALPFFVRRAPVEAVASPTEPTKFEPLPEGITAHLTEVGHLAGRRLFAIRYLADSRLVHGNDGAVGFVLLCSVQSDPPRFAPLIVAWGEDEGIIDDYSVSPVRQFGDFSFVWVRRDYSGTADSIGRTAVTAPNATTPLRAYPLFADTDPLAELFKQGWELWHRGNSFDEETLTWHYHIYRDPTKATQKDEYPHRQLRVRYKFRDGKLWPEKPEDDEDGG